MSPLVAHAVSLALFGGIASLFLLTQGLLVWAGLLAWALFLQAGGDANAFKKTVVGILFGAFLGWLAVLIYSQVPVPDGSWLWMPRYVVAIGITLLALGLAARIEVLSPVSTSLVGYAAVLGQYKVEVVGLTTMQRLTDLHLYNLFIAVAASMAAGALFGYLSQRLASMLASE